MKKFIVMALIAALIFSLPCQAADQGDRTQNYKPAEYALADIPSLLPLPKPKAAQQDLAPKYVAPKSALAPITPDSVGSIKIVKYRREMSLLDKSGNVIRTYKIALGQNPVGNKIREGDGRTPEGSYTITYRNPNSEYFRSIKISYPSPSDLARTRKLGVKNPGGDIFIHGTPPEKSWMFWRYTNLRDWTHGCVALSNKDMTEVWNLINEGTPVVIKP